MNHETTRRTFLKKSAEAAAITAAASTLGGVHAFGASTPEKLNLGIIGCGGIMTHHVKGLVERKEAVSISYLCDVDPRQIDRMATVMEGFQSRPAKRTSRFEDVIGDKNVDAVIIATPHHWHAPIALAAMMEGKDVYIEKPISHVYNEGHLIIEAAKKYKRVVQQGSQMRNSLVTKKAGRLLKQGIIGEVKVARAWTAETRKS
ncbi:MAG: Gfo/Idh/MocA family oxidoreductase [Planctomycetes bacterium]|nr:Gfo/Idh/MocA family oxidoreductase [Planctomycetota bacterium]